MLRLSLAGFGSLVVFSACISTQTSQVEQLTSAVGASRAPRWSPDGNRIAFESNREGNWEVYLLDLDSRDVERVTRQSSNERFPAWSPDGTGLVYQSDRGEEPDLFVHDLRSGRVERLVGIEGRELFPDWTESGVTFTLAEGDTFEIRMIRSGRTSAEPVLDEPGRDLWPRWSPDGRSLVFFSRRDTEGEDDEVYIWDRRTSRLARITDRPGHDFCPAWSPDGERIVMVSVEPDGQRSLRIVDREGRLRAELARGHFRVTEPSWSPDGRAIVYAAIKNEGDDYQLFVEYLAGH